MPVATGAVEFVSVAVVAGGSDGVPVGSLVVGYHGDLWRGQVVTAQSWRDVDST